MGCDGYPTETWDDWQISIHAARVGCDLDYDKVQPLFDISIHAARVGCDRALREMLKRLCVFQSTQPEWAATATGFGCSLLIVDISIHAARVGCDIQYLFTFRIFKEFQSTQPEWAATDAAQEWRDEAKISIHAARVGCDSIRINCNYYLFYSYKSAKLTFLLN